MEKFMARPKVSSLSRFCLCTLFIWVSAFLCKYVEGSVLLAGDEFREQLKAIRVVEVLPLPLNGLAHHVNYGQRLLERFFAIEGSSNGLDERRLPNGICYLLRPVPSKLKFGEMLWGAVSANVKQANHVTMFRDKKSRPSNFPEGSGNEEGSSDDVRDYQGMMSISVGTVKFRACAPGRMANMSVACEVAAWGFSTCQLELPWTDGSCICIAASGPASSSIGQGEGDVVNIDVDMTKNTNLGGKEWQLGSGLPGQAFCLAYEPLLPTFPKVDVSRSQSQGLRQPGRELGSGEQSVLQSMCSDWSSLDNTRGTTCKSSTLPNFAEQLKQLPGLEIQAAVRVSPLSILCTGAGLLLVASAEPMSRLRAMHVILGGLIGAGLAHVGAMVAIAAVPGAVVALPWVAALSAYRLGLCEAFAMLVAGYVYTFAMALALLYLYTQHFNYVQAVYLFIVFHAALAGALRAESSRDTPVGATGVQETTLLALPVDGIWMPPSMVVGGASVMLQRSVFFSLLVIGATVVLGTTNTKLHALMLQHQTGNLPAWLALPLAATPVFLLVGVEIHARVLSGGLRTAASIPCAITSLIGAAVQKLRRHLGFIIPGDVRRGSSRYGLRSCRRVFYSHVMEDRGQRRGEGALLQAPRSAGCVSLDTNGMQLGVKHASRLKRLSRWFLYHVAGVDPPIEGDPLYSHRWRFPHRRHLRSQPAVAIPAAQPSSSAGMAGWGGLNSDDSDDSEVDPTWKPGMEEDDRVSSLGGRSLDTQEPPSAAGPVRWMRTGSYNGAGASNGGVLQERGKQWVGIEDGPGHSVIASDEDDEFDRYVTDDEGDDGSQQDAAPPDYDWLAAEGLTPGEALASQSCPVCLFARKNLAFGCGHQTCRTCGSGLAKCPICRKRISVRIPLY